MPNLKLARIILFTRQMDAMSDFYGRILGLELISPAAGDDSKTWREYSAGSVNIALHSGPASPGNKGPKITFHADDVASLREELIARGARFGKVLTGSSLTLCNGKDPDGNPIQLSTR